MKTNLMPKLVYYQRKGLGTHWIGKRRLGGPESQSGLCGGEKNLVPLPGIKT
jgi:hypothetical protein